MEINESREMEVVGQRLNLCLPKCVVLVMAADDTKEADNKAGFSGRSFLTMNRPVVKPSIDP